MSKNSYTPGPWRVGVTGRYVAIATEGPAPDAPLGAVIAMLKSGSRRIHADAALIAAAPEMLAALEDAIRNVEAFEKRTGVPQFSLWVRNAREVIAKARGGS